MLPSKLDPGAASYQPAQSTFRVQHPQHRRSPHCALPGQLHVFCDASERAYGSVAYMRIVDNQGQIHVSFVLSRSRVAPRKQLSMPRLELCAALTGAQLAHLLQMELTVPIQRIILWSDSMTVLHWLYSESCRYKVFMGTRVPEIQPLTDVHHWRHVESIRNPADDITRGLALEELTRPHRWVRGPDFLYQSTDEWPVMPSRDLEPDKSELKKSAFVAAVSSSPGPLLPTASQFSTWKELILATAEILHRAAHPASNTVAELRRRHWVLRGREAIRKHQHSCRECRWWWAKSYIPKMADLPPSRVRFFKPPFYSTGVDCFGPFTVRLGRRHEKRWGIVYKCMTTRCIHLDLLASLDSDAFLMSLHQFISRRGKPYELLCDNGTNFVGGAREIWEAFTSIARHLQAQLAEQQIQFQFNPPSAPHFGGTWEREVKAVKTTLQAILREQVVPESVLLTVLVEVEGMLNAKPLGYLSSDVADPDPITPSLLLMGRHDSSLPQALYDSSNLLARRQWRHSQVLANHFWSAFTRHYFPTLQERQKWRTDRKELAVNQVVLIVDSQLPRAFWPVGRVTHTYPGFDGRIRIVSVQVKDRSYVRPVARLVPLPELKDDDQ